MAKKQQKTVTVETIDVPAAKATTTAPTTTAAAAPTTIVITVTTIASSVSFAALVGCRHQAHSGGSEKSVLTVKFYSAVQT